MRHIAVALAVLTAAVPARTAGEGPRPGTAAAWVYDSHRWAAKEIESELARLARHAERAYLSVEDGPRLLVDDVAGADRLARLLDLARERSGVEIHAMALQDPRWVSDPDGAAGRVARLLAFHRSRRTAGRPGFGGLHFDVEPHVDEAWVCGGPEDRRRLVRGLQALFERLARLVRDEDPALIVSAALPWWLGPLSAEVPDAAPARWLAILDEVVLMAYGDPGGPVVGGSGEAVLRRVDDRRLWAGLPTDRGLRVGLATYEYPDRAALQAAQRMLEARLGGRPSFRGTAVFAHGQPYAAPLSAVLEGRVEDETARPVPGARIQAGGRTAWTNRCGRFVIRGLGAGHVEVTAVADGFPSGRATVDGLVPGRERRLPPIVLGRRDGRQPIGP